MKGENKVHIADASYASLTSFLEKSNPLKENFSMATFSNERPLTEWETSHIF